MEDERVAAGRFDQRISGLDASGALCLLDHSQGDPVLDASAGIEVLQFRIHLRLDPEAFGQPVQADEGRISDVLRDGIESQRRHGGSGYGGHGGQ